MAGSGKTGSTSLRNKLHKMQTQKVIVSMILATWVGSEFKDNSEPLLMFAYKSSSPVGVGLSMTKVTLVNALSVSG